MLLTCGVTEIWMGNPCCFAELCLVHALLTRMWPASAQRGKDGHLTLNTSGDFFSNPMGGSSVGVSSGSGGSRGAWCGVVQGEAQKRESRMWSWHPRERALHHI